MEHGVGRQPHKTPHFNSRHRYTPQNDSPKQSLGPAQPPPHRCQAFPLLSVQMGYGLLCSLWVWRRTNRRPCCPPLSNPSTPTWPDGSRRWDNRMAAQNLPRFLGGLAVDKRRTRSNERRSRLLQMQNIFIDVLIIVHQISNCHIEAVMNNHKFIILDNLAAKKSGILDWRRDFCDCSLQTSYRVQNT